MSKPYLTLAFAETLDITFYNIKKRTGFRKFLNTLFTYVVYKLRTFTQSIPYIWPVRLLDNNDTRTSFSVNIIWTGPYITYRPRQKSIIDKYLDLWRITIRIILRIPVKILTNLTLTVTESISFDDWR